MITEKNKYLCITFTVKNKYLNKYQVFKFGALAQEDANGYRQGFLMGLCTFALINCPVFINFCLKECRVGLQGGETNICGAPTVGSTPYIESLIGWLVKNYYFQCFDEEAWLREVK